MRTKVGVFIVATLVSSACWCQADSADAPSLKLGDRWKYQVLDSFTGLQTATTEVRVVKVTANGYQLESASSSEATQTLDITLSLNERQSIDGVDGDTGEFDFPLKIGKKWKSLGLVKKAANGTTSLLDLEREVAAFEKVKTSAGEFDAYKIVAKGQWILKSDPLKVAISDFRGRFEVTAWYAPSVKRYVALHRASYAKGHVGDRIKVYLTEYELH
jgi:hypothetical protein